MKSDRDFLLHILQAILDARDYASVGELEFHRDKKTQDAMIRKLEIIGEATKRLSAEFKGAHADIPWRQIAGMRDKLIHDYFGVDLVLVWNVTAGVLPRLQERIEDVLGSSQPPR